MDRLSFWLLILGGVFNLGFAIFHLLFWRFFSWRTELPKMSPINGAIMQVLNLCLTFIFLFAAYLSFFHVKDLRTPGLGHALLAGFALFWFLRAIEQPIFFGLRSPVSIAFTGLFIVGAVFYTLPLWL